MVQERTVYRVAVACHRLSAFDTHRGSLCPLDGIAVLTKHEPSPYLGLGAC